MKKTIISIAAAALCMSALSVPAFAADILTDRNIYAADGERLAKSADNPEEWGINIDPNTVMPIYEARIMNYAETGSFELKQRIVFDGQEYLANALNEKGEFAGLVVFTVDGTYPGIGTHHITTDESRTADFAPNAKRITAAMKKQGIDTDCKEIRFAFVHDVGYVYYIDNGESRYLAATGMFEVNAEVLNEENGGIIEIDHELKAFADRELAEAKRYEEEVSDNSDPNTPPPVGGSETPPMFMADNTPYLNGAEAPSAPDNNKDNPNTGGVSSALGGGIALTACAIGVCAAKKKKDQ